MFKPQVALKLSVAILFAASAFGQHPEFRSKLFNAYYAQWTVYNGYTVKRLDTSGTARKLNILSYAFVNIGTNASGQYECTSFDSWADNGTAAGATVNTSVDGKVLPANGLTGNFGQLLLLKQQYPSLKIVITIGGASLPPQAFSAMASTAASRKHFVASCIADYIQGHFSGAFGQTRINGRQEYRYKGLLDPQFPTPRDCSTESKSTGNIRPLEIPRTSPS